MTGILRNISHSDIVLNTLFGSEIYSDTCMQSPLPEAYYVTFMMRFGNETLQWKRTCIE